MARGRGDFESALAFININLAPLFAGEVEIRKANFG
jgi:hypothetical protein